MSRAVLAIDYVAKKTGHEFHLPISTVFKKSTNPAEYSPLEKV